jgi:hypothetical protein
MQASLEKQYFETFDKLDGAQPKKDEIKADDIANSAVLKGAAPSDSQKQSVI